MYTEYDKIKRIPITIKPDSRRIILRKFNLEPQTISRIGQQLSGYSAGQIDAIHDYIMTKFSRRHRDFTGFLDSVYDELATVYPQAKEFNLKTRQVYCSYFVCEYSIEAAALFNPSMVLLPEKNGPDKTKFILSLRATGERHISSVEFMSGTIDHKGNIAMNPVGGLAEIPVVVRHEPGLSKIEFHPATRLDERVIFPVAPEEINGIEDVRLVRFEQDNQITYYGTFTAYDGHHILSKILKTTDFIKFDIHRMNGEAVNDKGMALFPRKINGRYAMISRQDGDNLRIMFSDNILNWRESTIIKRPQTPWELVKTGNCGSPLETPQGWLLLTHGVGPLREYVLGACLLDLNRPDKIIAVLPCPLLAPDADEREGYVPNVLYTCGGVIHNDQLIMPYAMSDAVTGFAITNVNELISNMKPL